MNENDSLKNSKFHSFPQNHPLEDRMKEGYDILDFQQATSQIRETMIESKVGEDTTESADNSEAKEADNSKSASDIDQDRSTIVRPGNLPEKLGQKIYDLLHREGSVPMGHLSTILEQIDKQPIKTAPEFFNPGAAKERLSDAARQLQFEKDCLEAGIDPREAELMNFGEITSPKTSIIPFPKDEGLISAISFIAIAALLISTVVLDYFF
jgi:hypothetical protein